MKLIDFLKKNTIKQNIILFGPVPLKNNEIQKINELSSNSVFIFLDGGLNNKSKVHISDAAISIGDNDSNKTPENLDILLPEDKDFTDLQYALNQMVHLTSDKVVKLFAFGLLGQRDDHHLINLGQFHHFISRINFRCILEISNHIYISNQSKFEFNRNGLFSLIAFRHTKVLLKGECKYHINPTRELLPFDGLTLSNIGHGKVIVEQEHPVFIIFEQE